nr:hypothetical protein Iba_chr13aCG11880 [Ipomoea batatas]
MMARSSSLDENDQVYLTPAHPSEVPHPGSVSQHIYQQGPPDSSESPTNDDHKPQPAPVRRGRGGNECPYDVSHGGGPRHCRGSKRVTSQMKREGAPKHISRVLLVLTSREGNHIETTQKGIIPGCEKKPELKCVNMTVSRKGPGMGQPEGSAKGFNVSPSVNNHRKGNNQRKFPVIDSVMMWFVIV